MTDRAMRYLEQDRLNHIDMIEPLRRGSGIVRYVDTDGVLVFEQVAEQFGAFCDDELAGFIGLHEEGSMGMLEVKPVFRHRGRVPFSQVVRGNTESENLHKRIGFTISTDYLYWLEQ